MPTIQAIASNSSPMAIASFILQYLALFNAIVFIIYLKSNLVLKFLSPILLKIPVISSILKNYEIYKFALIYSQCVDAGLPVAQSFKASLKSLFPTPLKHDFENAAILASDGLSFFETLYNSSHIPFESVNQWEIGHQSGKEEQALEALSSRSLKDTLNQLGILSWLLQKAILAVVALTIFLTMKSMIGERFNMLDDLIQ
jgi:type II secretory pathway component PulF